MMPTAPAVMSSAMSSCARRRSRERRAARGSGSRCCSTAGSPRGYAHGTALRPDHHPSRRRPAATVGEQEIVRVLASMALACAAAA